MPRVSLGTQGEVRLPAEVIGKLRLRKGARLEVIVSGDCLVLVSPSRIPKEQRYFWTTPWQEREREADADISVGRVQGPFGDAAAAIKALRGKKA